ncbi:MAG: Glycerol-3-phosphate acyltransferase [Candidatus Dichloromethanomonas elyunquensis]|nr:MAG: Glycerol-3-phosphate acyltransferase [Candidatus Dichloromethanomonas elyunquensis]
MSYWVFLIAYILGAIPSAYLAGKFNGIDIRQHGSGNMGATNAYRLLGQKWGIGVLVCDAVKGGVATYLCLFSFGAWGGVAGGLLAMLGHSFNPFFGFKPSGKGVASGLGVITVLIPKVMLIAITVFVLVVAVSRYVSLGSVLAALTVLVMVFAFNEPAAYQLFALIAVSMVVFRHRSNMKRILDGTEAKFGHKKGE